MRGAASSGVPASQCVRGDPNPARTDSELTAALGSARASRLSEGWRYRCALPSFWNSTRLGLSVRARGGDHASYPQPQSSCCRPRCHTGVYRHHRLLFYDCAKQREKFRFKPVADSIRVWLSVVGCVFVSPPSHSHSLTEFRCWQLPRRFLSQPMLHTHVHFHCPA